MLPQYLLDLERAELVPAALENVDARTPEDAQVTVRVAGDGVAGLEPAHSLAQSEGLSRCVGSLVVPGEHARPGDPQLAGV